MPKSRRTKNNETKLTGAGVFIIEQYKGTPVVVLFREENGTYSDPGGHIDKGESPHHAAYRELREETCNLIHLKPKQLATLAAQILVKEYLVYMMFVENLSYTNYMRNCNHIKTVCTSCGIRPGESKTCKHWWETDHMVRIPVKHILHAAVTNSEIVYDFDMVPVRLRDRVLAIVKTAYHIIEALIKLKPFKLTKQLVHASRIPCLVGTVTYTLPDGLSAYPLDYPLDYDETLQDSYEQLVNKTIMTPIL